MFEVIDAVKRVSGANFEVQNSDRRPGDPAALVAAPEKIHDMLGWRPKFDDLDTIVRHALSWEQQLAGFRVAS